MARSAKVTRKRGAARMRQLGRKLVSFWLDDYELDTLKAAESRTGLKGAKLFKDLIRRAARGY